MMAPATLEMLVRHRVGLFCWCPRCAWRDVLDSGVLCAACGPGYPIPRPIAGHHLQALRPHRARGAAGLAEPRSDREPDTVGATNLPHGTYDGAFVGSPLGTGHSQLAVVALVDVVVC